MVRFIIVVIIVGAIVAGAYYYISIKPVQEVSDQQIQAAQKARIKQANQIPANAVMEDGTLPE